MMLRPVLSADTSDAILDGVIRLEPVNVDSSPETNNFRAVDSNTGTKTNTALMDVPQTINVVDRDLFSLEGSRSLEDVLSNVAGVSPSVGDGQRDQVYIRGFVATNDEYIDGVRDSETYFRDLANIESVEVIQGPAAALYGHGSAGGIINRVTRKPSDAAVGEVDFTFGTWGDERAELDAGGPLSFGHLTYRLDAALEQSGGFRNQYFLERDHVSPSVAWSPSKDTRVLVQFDTLTDRRLDDLGMPALVGLAGSGFYGTTPNVPISSYYGSPDGHKSDYVLAEVNSATVAFDKTLRKGWSLHDTTRTEHYTLDRNNILPTGVYVPGGSVFNGNLSQVWVNRSGRHILRNQNDVFNQLESVWTTDAASFSQRILLGLEVARQTAGVNSEQFAEAPVALVDPVLIATPSGAAPSSHTHSAVSSDTAGLYLQDQIDLSSHFKALLGVRFDYFSVEQDNLLPPTTDLYNLNRTASPRAGLVWEPTKLYSLYASVGRSFQPSGDGLSVAATNAALAPQETINYEVGSKMNMDGGRLTTSVALFQAERNISETNPLNGTVSNVGNQRSRGIELAVAGHLSRSWSISAAYSLLDAAIVDGGYDSGGVLLNGRLPGLVPRNSATLFTAYERPNGFGIGAGMVSMGGRYTSNDDSVSLPAFAAFNAVAYYRGAHWEARLNLNNVLNHRYFVTAGEGTDVTGQTVMPGAPINLGVTLVRHF
jgi:catecholate siderophore receptor